ncbi:5-oxoprolinase subunit B family protein [Litoribacter populi]|uniref:5-oxoprolinase subunit B family protein n=1 Tax=Litoribacter populi TaxID=2598460 RepID=UPI00117E32CD|nr:allophanate hydrolase subunit 1 [Litoribacter populi]
MIQVFQIAPNIVEIQWPKEISVNILMRKAYLKKQLIQQFHEKLLRAISGYHMLGLYFSEPMPSEKISQISKEILAKFSEGKKIGSTLWRIPVCYDGKDLNNLAKQKNISKAKLIKLHASQRYHIHFYGFLPGFIYLGGLNEKLATARKSTPDREIPAGSVAIGGNQTGIYPSNSPGGWHVIGRTPIRMFDTSQSPPVWGIEGDMVEFFQISEEEFSDYLSKKPEKVEHA